MTQKQDAVGSVAEEAAKLLQALQGWNTDGGRAAHAAAAAGFAEQLASVLGPVHEHLGEGGADCGVCPLCRVAARVRQTSPEVKEHLTTAATSLVNAVAAFMAPVPRHDADPGAAAGPPGGSGRDADRSDVQ